MLRLYDFDQAAKHTDGTANVLEDMDEYNVSPLTASAVDFMSIELLLRHAAVISYGIYRQETKYTTDIVSRMKYFISFEYTTAVDIWSLGMVMYWLYEKLKALASGNRSVVHSMYRRREYIDDRALYQRNRPITYGEDCSLEYIAYLIADIMKTKISGGPDNRFYTANMFNDGPARGIKEIFDNLGSVKSISKTCKLIGNSISNGYGNNGIPALDSDLLPNIHAVLYDLIAKTQAINSQRRPSAADVVNQLSKYQK